MDFGGILEAAGDFGLFQKLILLGLTCPIAVFSMFISSLIFIQSDPDRHCDTNWILQVDPNLSKEEQLNLTVPRLEDGTLSRCQMFVPVDWNISDIRTYGLNETTGCQDGWVYEETLYEATVVTDYNLVCDQAGMVTVAQAVFMAGILVGSFVFGPLTESYGRRGSVRLTAVLQLIFAVLTGASPNLYVFLVSQFIVGVGIAGFRINATILATEWVGVRERSYAACLAQIFASIGQCLMALLKYLILDWRTAQYVFAGLHCLTCTYIWFIPESARWLLAQGRTAEAKNLILKVAAINKRKIPENVLNKVSEAKAVQKGGVQTICKSPILVKHVLIVSFAWFSLNLGYFCLILNVGQFGLNIFVVQTIFGATEIPAHLLCIWFLELLGRRVCLSWTLLIGGSMCVLSLAFTQDDAISITALVTVGKLFLSWAGSVCMVYIQELVPTSVRQTAVGCGSMGMRAAGLMAPLVNMLATYHWTIPILVFSCLCLLSGLMGCLLPETRGTELFERAEKAEDKRDATVDKTSSDADQTKHNIDRSTKL